jgi:hypothetical protein
MLKARRQHDWPVQHPIHTPDERLQDGTGHITGDNKKWKKR